MIRYKIPKQLLSFANKRADWNVFSKEVVNNLKNGGYAHIQYRKWAISQLTQKKKMPQLKRAIIFFYQIKPLFDNGYCPKNEFQNRIKKSTKLDKSTISNYKKLLIDYGFLKEEESQYRLRSQEYLWKTCGIFTNEKTDKVNKKTGKHRTRGNGKKIFYYKPYIGDSVEYLKQTPIEVLRIHRENCFQDRSDFLREVANVLTIREFSCRIRKARKDRRRCTNADIHSLKLTSNFYAHNLGFSSINSGYLYRKILETTGQIKIKKNRDLIDSEFKSYEDAQIKFNNQIGGWSDNHEGYLKWLKGKVYVINSYDVSHNDLKPVSIEPAPKLIKSKRDVLSSVYYFDDSEDL